MVGRSYVVDVGSVAHGGFCVARHEGRAVFVRHCLPGERVRAVVTEGGEGDRYWRADAVEVLRPAPGRVQPPCPFAGPGRCGACDWQHAALPTQRELKAAVVEEALRRLAGLDWDVAVEEVPGACEGLGWRTRVQFAVDPDGRAGLRRHRSHQVEPLDACLIAHPYVEDLGLEKRRWPGARAIEAVASATTGERHYATEPPAAGQPPAAVVELAAGRSWRVTGGGFWQVHPGAADVLAAAVLTGLDPRPGEAALDLYSGVGLFAGVLADRLGPDGRVTAVEGHPRAVADARHNLADLATVRLVTGRVDRALARLRLRRIDLVVLDPPRVGAGRDVVARVGALHPRRIAYVACDPAALARDLAWLADGGYQLTGLRAFDLFPMTHHVECVALLEPAAGR